MDKRVTSAVALICALASGLSASACGGSPDNGASPSPSATPNPSLTTATSALASWAQRVDNICGSIDDQLNQKASASATTSDEAVVIAGLVAGAYQEITQEPSPTDTGATNFVAALNALSSAWNDVVNAIKEGSGGQFQSASASLSQAKQELENAANSISATRCAELATR